MVYIIGKLLGRGGFGNVYLARDEEIDKTIVVKIVPYNEQTIGRIKREVQLPQLLTGHKNIAAVLDAQVVNSNVYIISEYIANAITLDKWRLPNLDTTEGILILLDVMSDLVDAYIYIHNHDIAHRDVKLENILMKGNIPIVIDWDLGCLHQEESSLPCEGFVGTREYIAPEVWRKEDIDPFLADIYSLGIVFYNLANQRRFPYRGETNQEIKQDVLYGYPEMSTSGYFQLDDMIMAMININPEERLSLDEAKSIIQTLIKTI